jgi:hypothetical protein
MKKNELKGNYICINLRNESKRNFDRQYGSFCRH